ncbi:peroxisome-assembly ATPase [Malassezia cuniculi]|uniref:Peroxisome-assembly ATPase n=1 Tax=Malassezia cuniculi TaxID=948313 RepID=A0AAF0ESW1_9BASI|nr:peroxisome-assembly ATPase [Malassezia cuniculi]
MYCRIRAAVHATRSLRPALGMSVHARTIATSSARLVAPGRVHAQEAAPAASAAPSAPESNTQKNAVGSPSEAYERLVGAGKLRDDSFQRRIVGMLDTLYHELESYEQPPVPEPEEGLVENSAPTGMLGRLREKFKPAEPEVERKLDQMVVPNMIGSFMSLFSKPQVEREAIRPEGVPPSLYLHGDVGTGKSMLMDMFYSTLPPNIERKRRVHFHQFMIDVHKRSHFYKSKYHRASGIVGGAMMNNSGALGSAHEGSEIDPIEPVVREIARDAQVLCFDEFQVTDIADAMILRRVLERLMELGVVIVMTSNRPPAELYKNGIQRASFIPCIKLIETQYTVTDLNSGTDYRRVPRQEEQVYFLSSDEEGRRAFEDAWERELKGATPEPTSVEVWGRNFNVPQSAPGVARLTFNELCGDARSAADYIALCAAYHTIFVENIPCMDLNMRAMARRFITFIDAAYESKTRFMCSSEVDIMKVFSGSGNDEKPTSAHMRALMDDLKLTMDDIGGSSIFSGDEELII